MQYVLVGTIHQMRGPPQVPATQVTLVSQPIYHYNTPPWRLAQTDEGPNQIYEEESWGKNQPHPSLRHQRGSPGPHSLQCSIEGQGNGANREASHNAFVS